MWNEDAIVQLEVLFLKLLGGPRNPVNTLGVPTLMKVPHFCKTCYEYPTLSYSSADPTHNVLYRPCCYYGLFLCEVKTHEVWVTSNCLTSTPKIVKISHSNVERGT
jgi:hypothetical protein